MPSPQRSDEFLTVAVSGDSVSLCRRTCFLVLGVSERLEYRGRLFDALAAAYAIAPRHFNCAPA